MSQASTLVTLRDARIVSGDRVVSPASRTTVRFSWWVWATIAALVVWGSFSANPLLTPAAILVLAAAMQLLWRRGEPPVLAFACGMQWLQVGAVIFYANLYGASLEQASGAKQFETATWLSLIAVFVLALGMRMALVRCRSQHAPLLTEALRVNIGTAFVAYLVTFVIALAAERIAFSVPAVTQLIYALIPLKWAAVFIVAYSIVEQRKSYILLVAIACVESAVGLLGYFASFKDVFFVLLVVATTSPLALRGRRLAIASAVLAALFLFGVVWTAIKSEYREFISQGTNQQVVVVSTEEKVNKLEDLVSGLNWDNFTDGLDRMIVRVGYTNFFALTLMNVPENVPYENGALWLGSLKHCVTPRLFFPEKAAISDSERTTLYTGIQTAGEEQGTSIGIGYIAESYVDFGPVGMFAPIFLLGIFCGLIYRMCISHSHSKLLSTAFGSSILIFNAYAVETSNVKIVGGIVTELLVIGAVYLLFGKAFRAWLEHGR